MKHILFSLFLICAFAMTADAQVQYRFGMMEDTLAASETVYLYPTDAATAIASPNFRDFGALEVVMVYDSLSGNPAGTALLQYCYDDACTYTYDATTLTLNGSTASASTVSRTEDAEFVPLKWRIKVTTTGTTQSDRLRVYYGWKRKT